MLQIIRIAFGRLCGIFFPHGGLCQFNEVRIVSTAGSAVAGDHDQQYFFNRSCSG